MKGILEYLERIQKCIIALTRVEIERYEEQILSKERGNLRIRLRFTDNSLLEISEAVYIIEGMPIWLSYRYHYQHSDASIIFRYDNTPHYPDISTFPHHKHTDVSVVGAARPDIEQVLSEVKRHIKS
jgi:hypothetical protein